MPRREMGRGPRWAASAWQPARPCLWGEPMGRRQGVRDGRLTLLARAATAKRFDASSQRSRSAGVVARHLRICPARARSRRNRSSFLAPYRLEDTNILDVLRPTCPSLQFDEIIDARHENMYAVDLRSERASKCFVEGKRLLYEKVDLRQRNRWIPKREDRKPFFLDPLLTLGAVSERA